MSNKSNQIDGVATLKAVLGGGLLGVAKRMGWSEAEAARHMKSSQSNASNLLANEISRIPLEALIDMSVACEISLDLRLTLPSKFFQ